MPVNPCNCASCQMRRMAAPLVMIAIGVLLLAHMLRPGFDVVAMVASFLIFVGALQLAQYAAPRNADIPHVPRGSIFVPLLLIALGTLMLVRHLLPQFPMGDWIAHYWPVLLILWGLTRLLEHFALPQSRRPGFSGGEILVVVLIVVFGLAFSGIYRFQQSHMADYMGVNVGDWNMFTQPYAYTAAAHHPLGAGETVLIRAYRGDIELIPGPAGSVAAALADTVRADGSANADRVFQRSQPVLRQEGGQLVVLPAGDAAEGSTKADLKLTLPASTSVFVQLQNGNVTVARWQADLNIHVGSEHDSVSLDQVAGNVAINGSGDDVAISNVTGSTTLQGQFVGSLSFRNLAQGLRFNSSRTSMSVTALPGAINYDMGQITVTQAANLDLRTRDEEIDVRACTGPMQIDSRNESIRVTSDIAPLAPITITNHDADVHLNLPAASRFSLDATSHNGDIENDFGIPQVNNHHQAESHGATAPPGPAIHIETTNGTIAVRKQA